MPKVSSGVIGKLKEGKFVTMAELEVDSQTSIEELLDRAKSLQNSVDAVIVSRDPKSSLYLNNLIPCFLMKERLKLEPVYSVDGRDKNRLGLFSDILTASQLGLTDIIVSTGIHTTTGTYIKAKPVFDVDAVQLITMIRDVNNGKAFSGEVPKTAGFDIGAVVGFDHSRPEMEEMMIQKKKDAGASYLVTVPIYESEKAKMIANRTSKIGIPLVVTLYPIDSVETANSIGKVFVDAKPPEDFLNKIREIEQGSTKAETKNKEISSANRNLVDVLVKELKTIKGVSGCNIVSTKLDVIKAPS
nr:methylenetetrahydrofolate reductase [Candidatus Njordarchaeum guaymaensis]